MNYYPEKINGFSKFARGKFRFLPGYTGLYLSEAFRSLGMNLIGLYIPLYILSLTHSLVLVFLFYALYHFFVVVSDYPVALLTKYLGIDLVAFLGALTRVFFIFLLIKAENNPSLIWLASILWGIDVTLTWLPYHYTFTIAEKEDGKYGKEVSRYQIVSKITQMIGPVAGGVTIATLGFKPLFSSAIVLIAVSGLPLFFDTIKGKGMRLSFKKITYHLKSKKKSKFWLSFVGAQLKNIILGLVWPLFIFLAVKNYETLGIIKSGATFVSILIVWSLGKWIDRRGKSILHLGTIINSFNVLLRSFIFNPFALFLIDSAYDITSSLIVTPFDTAFYEEAIKMRKLEFIVEREFVLHGSGTIICLVLGLLFALRIPWFWIFSLAIIGLLMQNYILSGENKSKK